MTRLWLSLCLILVFGTEFLFADELLKITAPYNLTRLFNYRGEIGSIPESPALFGIPSYLKQVQGIVLTLPDQTVGPNGEQYGCDPYDFNNGKNAHWIEKRNLQVPLILLVERGGGCTFVTKIRNAQYAGAASVIVYDNNPGAWVIPYMAADPTAETVKIPSMMIRYVDGVALKHAIEGTDWQSVEYEPVRATLKYFLPRPDDRVETDFWSVSHDKNTGVDDFKRTIGSAMRHLSNHILFTPHFFTLEGRIYNCQYNDRCGPQCFNGGKYCSPDPEGKFGEGYDGNDIVLENTREIVLWRALNSTGQNSRMFEYWEQFYTECNTADKWKAGCGPNIIDRMNIGYGINSAYIQRTIDAAGGLAYPGTYTDNTILNEELVLQNAKGIFQSPQFYTNNVPYLGEFRCPTPITQSKCGLLQQICAGYAEGTTPAACNTDPNCPFGEGCESPKSNRGATIGAVIGIVIGFAVLVGGLVFWYMKRQQKQVKEDIDVLLKQYLPLDEGIGSSSNNNNGFSASNSRQTTRNGGFTPVRNDTNIDPEEDVELH